MCTAAGPTLPTIVRAAVKEVNKSRPEKQPAPVVMAIKRKYKVVKAATVVIISFLIGRLLTLVVKTPWG